MSRINTQKDIGILIIRVVIGLTMFAFHGLPKISGGPELWAKIGLSMNYLGINFLPMLWGFAAAFTETICAILIILGLWTKPSSILLAFTMLIATISHFAKGDGFSGSSHAIELMAIFVGLYFTGAGKYSVDKK